ncbi:hypothetical protein F4778DRAFT_189059 [Xylariomycetidae sp. FL2044]|nr:hypothetical protein F4778DRAFT_189059 [Xylariomycetidae sp. FL2044]
MSRYDDDYRGRSSSHHRHHHHYHHRRDDSLDSLEEIPPYPMSEAPGGVPRISSPGHTTYNGPRSQARLTYEPQSPYYPPSPRSPSLQVPESHSRPRSLPPLTGHHRRSSSYESRREKGSDERHHSARNSPRSPVDKARQFVDNTFSDSPTGLGVGVLGAVVGGLAAREAAEATRGYHGGDSESDHRRNTLISTVVGAAVGALGANAVEKRLQVNNEKHRIKQEKWERKWRPRGGDEDEAEVLERREVVARPKSGGDNGGGGGGGGGRGGRAGRAGGKKSRGRERELDELDDLESGRFVRRPGGGSGMEREVDPEARSWKNVEDWLYDDRDARPKSSGQGSLGGSYRY